MAFNCRLTASIPEANLATFCEHWEDADRKSKYPRSQCFLMPYKTWLEKHGHFVPTLDRPVGLGMIGGAVWWDTPIEFVCHQIAADKMTKSTPERAEDVMLLKEQMFQSLPVE